MTNKSTITVYSTATCGYCNMLKNWFKENGVSFQEKRVDKDYEAAREMMLKSGQMGVPFSVVLGKDGIEQTVLGFDVPKFKSILGI
jgi:glutaredoxin 3